MRSSVLSFSGLVLLGSYGIASARNCNPHKCTLDQCYNEVDTQNAKARHHHRADCSSFLATTVTPSTVTVTVTTTPTVGVYETDTVDVTVLTTETDSLFATLTSTDIIATTVDVYQTTTVPPPAITITEPFRRRFELPVDRPSLVPSYASACTSEGQFASACSCLGVLPSTVVASTPSITVTVTASSTVTTTNEATVSAFTTEILTSVLVSTTVELVVQSTTIIETIEVTATATPCVPTIVDFQLRASPSPSPGGYAYVSAPFGNAVVEFSPQFTNAATFSLDDMGHLVLERGYSFEGQTGIASINTDTNYSLIVFRIVADIEVANSGFVAITCELVPPADDPTSLVLSCNNGGNSGILDNVIQYDGSNAVLADQLYDTALQLKAFDIQYSSC